jgi:antitoxin ParD1/3/4
VPLSSANFVTSAVQGYSRSLLARLVLGSGPRVSCRKRGNTNNWYHSRVGKNTSFSLDEHYSAFIESEVASGRYRSASDVVRSALRLLEDRETQLRALREALAAGERRGASTPFDFDAFLDRRRAEESPDR